MACEQQRLLQRHREALLKSRQHTLSDEVVINGASVHVIREKTGLRPLFLVNFLVIFWLDMLATYHLARNAQEKHVDKNQIFTPGLPISSLRGFCLGEYHSWQRTVCRVPSYSSDGTGFELMVKQIFSALLLRAMWKAFKICSIGGWPPLLMSSRTDVMHFT